MIQRDRIVVLIKNFIPYVVRNGIVLLCIFVPRCILKIFLLRDGVPVSGRQSFNRQSGQIPMVCAVIREAVGADCSKGQLSRGDLYASPLSCDIIVCRYIVITVHDLIGEHVLFNTAI